MTPLLELRGITKRYEGVQDDVLAGVDFAVNKGESVAIVGPSGSGKSTLLNIMGTLDTPSAGSVSLDGKNLLGLNEKEIAGVRNQRIGFVFQLHHLLPQCTILENVLVPALVPGDMDAAEQHGRELLDRVGLSHRLHHRPSQLSGGERQRVAVVRALINRPMLLLADEPTGSLDRAASDSMGDLIAGLNADQGVTLVTVTHSSRLARRMNRIVELRDGHLNNVES